MLLLPFHPLYSLSLLSLTLTAERAERHCHWSSATT
jgi:hypothetical protein